MAGIDENTMNKNIISTGTNDEDIVSMTCSSFSQLCKKVSKLNEMDNGKSIDINELSLPIRAKNALLKADIHTISVIDKLSDEELLLIPHMGKTQVIDVRRVVNDIHRRLSACEDLHCKFFDMEMFVNMLDTDINKRVNNFRRVKRPVRDSSGNYINRVVEREYLFERVSKIIDTFDSNVDLSVYLVDPKVMSFIYDDVLVNAVKSIVLHVLESLAFNCSLSNFNDYLPESFLCLGQTKELLQKMVDDKEIDFYFGRYMLIYDRLIDRIEELPDGDRHIVRKFLMGMTYKEIDSEFDVKGRAYRTVSHLVKKRMRVYENRYLYWFKRYNMDSELFCYLFDVDPCVYVYMLCMCKNKKGTLPWRDIINDKYATDSMRQKLMDRINQGKIKINDDIIDCRKSAMADYIMKNYHSDESVSLELIGNECAVFCDKYDVCDDLSAEDAMAAIRAHFELNRNRVIIMSGVSRFRYYDIDSRDIEKLIASIDFGKYMDKVISAKRLFIDNAEIMSEYDIRNEYELHNIFKKCSNFLPDWVGMGRVPTINVGNVDREKQVVSLLEKLAPVSTSKFMNVFEELYGIEKTIFVANWKSYIDKYKTGTGANTYYSLKDEV